MVRHHAASVATEFLCAIISMIDIDDLDVSVRNWNFTVRYSNDYIVSFRIGQIILLGIVQK